MEREQEWLRLKLQRGYEGLMRQRRGVERAATRAASGDKQIAVLTARIESYLEVGNRIKAWHHALELDQLRRSVERDHRELHDLRKAYEEHVAELAHLGRRRRDLQERLRAQQCQAVGLDAR
jgi:hypothetical protein